jgi:hypothetical protein
MTSDLDVVDKDTIQMQPVLVPLASPSCREVCTALAAAQGEFEVPKRTKEAAVRGQTKTGGSYDYKYKYAPLEEIISAVKDSLAKHGLFRQQYLVTKGGVPVIRTIIWHSSGEWIASDYPIHQSKDGAQGFAAGVTYARRYGLSLALGLAPEDDDDANEGAKITDARPRRPAPPAPNPMTPHDPETGEIIEPGSPLASSSQRQAATTAPSGDSSHDSTKPDGAVPDDATVALRDEAREAARRGRATFATLWQRLSFEQRKLLAPVMDELGRLTREADALTQGAR